MMKQNGTLQIKTSTKPLPSLQPMVDWYLKHNLLSGEKCISHRDAFVCNINHFREKVLSGTLSVHEIVDLFFNNAHFWALKSFHKNNVYLPVRSEFERLRPWTTIPGSYQNFEDIYSWIESRIQPLGATQLVIYDLSLWLSALDPSDNLLPRDYVYVHATPMTAYKRLYVKGFVKHKPKHPNDIIPITAFPSPFNLLTAYEIEDLLCNIGKCLKRLTQANGKPINPCVSTGNTPSTSGVNPYDDLMIITKMFLY